MDIIKELMVFNHIKYYDEPHIYYINGEKKPDKWAEKQGHFYTPTSMADKYAHKQNYYPMDSDPYDRPDYDKPKPVEEWVSEKDIDKLWKYKNHHATYEGSTLHDYAENYLSNRIMPEPKVSPEGLKFEEIEETYEVMKQHFHNFYNDTVAKGKLIPVKSELVIGDKDLMLCGMVDQLFWNERYQCYQIWDWKTNTKLRMKSDYGNKMKGPLYMLDDCEFNTYSLQLSVYKKMIEMNTNIKLGESNIVWFNEENQNYKIIKCKDYSDHVDNMFETLKTKKQMLS